MAQSTYNVVFDVETKKAIKNIEGFSKSTDAAFTGLATSVKLLGAAFVGFVSAGALVSGLKKSVDAATEAEQSIQKLNNALALSGEFSQEQSERFQNLAQSLQSSIGISDEVILNQVAIAKAFGVTNDQAEKLIKASADLAAATGISLDEAVQHLSKSFDGTAGRLNELVPGIRTLTAEQLKAGAAIDLVAGKFAGSAEAIGQTFGGALNRASLSFGDLFEELGKAIIATPAVVKVINLLVKSLNEMIGFIKSNEDAIQNLVKFGLDALGFALKATAKVFKVFDLVLQESVRATVQFEEGAKRLAVAIRSIPGVKLAFDKKVTDNIEASANSLKLVGQEIKANQVAQHKAIDTFVDGYDKAITSTDKLGKAQKNQSQIAVKGLKEQEDAAKKAAEAFKKQVFDVSIAAAGAVGAAAQGPAKSPAEDAATKLVTVFVAKVGEALVPGLGPVFGELASILSRGGEAVRSAITELFKAIPQIISTILLSIDDLLLAIVANLDELIVGIVQAVPEFLRQFLSQLGPIVLTLIQSLVEAIAGVILSLPDIILGFIEGADLFIEGLINGLPRLIERLPEIAQQFIQALVAKMPELITALVAQMPRISAALIAEMPKIAIQFAIAFAAQAPTMAISFITALIEQAPRFVDELVNQVKSLFGLGESKKKEGEAGKSGGGVVQGLGDAVNKGTAGLRNALKGLGKVLGFAEGGVVPLGFPNDSALIRATSGELIVDREDTNRLSRFLDREDGPEPRRETERQQAPQQLTINLMVGERKLADVILDLNRQGFRLA